MYTQINPPTSNVTIYSIEKNTWKCLESGKNRFSVLANKIILEFFFTQYLFRYCVTYTYLFIIVHAIAYSERKILRTWIVLYGKDAVVSVSGTCEPFPCVPHFMARILNHLSNEKNGRCPYQCLLKSLETTLKTGSIISSIHKFTHLNTLPIKTCLHSYEPRVHNN